jgi:putative FmdB family regulatory protein
LIDEKLKSIKAIFRLGDKMPLYEYYCDKCGKVFEIKVPLARYGEEIRCPYCGEPLKRHISPVSFIVR